MPFSWFPEPYQAYGGFAADGLKKVLGRPRLDPLVVLVREAVQNSWDARVGAGQVKFTLDHRTLTAPQRRFLSDEVFAGEFPPGTGLAESLSDRSAGLLIVSDRGTTGLTGAMRADIAAPEQVEERFVRLVFNVGQPSEREQRGGTYGFGKTISFVVSRAGATIIRTRTKTGGKLEDRLIAVALGEQYDRDGRKFTGRHWWGAPAEPGIAPLTGAAAVRVASKLGLPEYEGDATGTDIVIVAPDLGERSPAEAMSFMRAALTWYFWPKMTAERRRQAPMAFDLRLDGAPLDPPRPGATHPLDAYSEALRAVRAAERGVTDADGLVTLREIRSERPRRRLGWLAVTPVMPGTGDPSMLDPEGGFGTVPSDDDLRHVALMRQPELVVEYVQGPSSATSGVRWAAVFKCESDLDPLFANAEPPTHDTWNPELLQDRAAKSAVTVAKRRIGETLAELFESPRPNAPASTRSAVQIADALGGLIAHTAGGGPGRQPGRRERERERKAPHRHVTVRDTGHRFLESSGAGRIRTWLQFDVLGDVTAPVILTASAHAATEDGSGVETDPPVGAAVPRVVGFQETDESDLLAGEELELGPDSPRRWWVAAEAPDDIAVALDIVADEP